MECLKTQKSATFSIAIANPQQWLVQFEKCHESTGTMSVTCLEYWNMSGIWLRYSKMSGIMLEYGKMS